MRFAEMAAATFPHSTELRDGAYVSHAARSRSAIAASTARPAAARAAVCARGEQQTARSLLLPAHSCATGCRYDSSHGPSLSPRVCQSVSERLAEVGGPSLHTRPARERLPACGLCAAGQGARLAAWHGGGAASSGLHNPGGCIPHGTVAQ
jgi:hypothetical protein